MYILSGHIPVLEMLFLPATRKHCGLGNADKIVGIQRPVVQV